MEWSIIALGVAAFAMWWTHTPDKTKEAPPPLKNKGVSFSVADLVTHHPKLKAI